MAILHQMYNAKLERTDKYFFFQKRNQVGDLMIMTKPQTKVWGNPDKSTVASERRFMVED